MDGVLPSFVRAVYLRLRAEVDIGLKPIPDFHQTTPNYSFAV